MGVILVGLSLVMSGCGAATTLSLGSNTKVAGYVDDLYGVHDIEGLREAERLLAQKEAAARAEREKRIAAMIAADNAAADIDEILGDVASEGSYAGTVLPSSDGDVNITYNNIYVDDYASAYARRLQGFTSLTYRMPSSYWDYRYGDSYFLTLAYDPAFYTVMVMGDQVWVEPRYITNMFGSWNNPYYYGYRYGYNPYYYGYSYGYWDYWGWNSPYWGCDPYYHFHYHHWYDPYHPHYGHHHHPHHPHYPAHKPAGPGGPGGHRDHKVTHRPSYGGGGGSSMRPSGGALSYNDRLGGRGGTQIANGNNNTANRSSSSATTGSSVRPIRGGATTANGSGTRTPAGGSISKPTSKHELSGSLSGTTIGTSSSRGVRGGGSSGVSNSSSRSSRSSVGTRSTSSTSEKKSSSINRSSSGRSSSSVSSSNSSRSSSRSSSSSVSRSSSSRSSSSVSRSSSNMGSSSRSSSSSMGGSSRSSSSRSGR